MYIYVLMIIISVLFAFLAFGVKKQYDNKKTRNLKAMYVILCIASFLFPFLLSAFRDISIGTDTSGTYYNIYLNVLHNVGGIRDVGYSFINRVAIFFSSNYSGVLLLTSLIFCGLSFKCIFSESKNPPMSVLLFFITNVYFISMNMVRQSIAISLFMISIPYIKNKSFFKFFVLNLIATSIHTTSLIYIFLYFILDKEIKVRHIIIICLIFSLFSGILGNSIISFLNKFDYFKKYFAWYLSSRFANGNLNVYSLLINICLLLFLFFINKSAKEDKDYKIMLWLETSAVISLLLSSYIPLMQRVSWMFSFPMFVYLPKMFDFIKDSKIRMIAKVCVIGCFIAYMSITIFMNGYNEVVPYKSIFG